MNFQRTSIAAAFAIVTIAGTVITGQLIQSQPESISIPVGEIFEMQAVGGNEKISWVLMQNREFIEANRDKVFRTRFSQQGTFTLSAETEQDGQTVRKIFTISVLDRKPGYENEGPSGGGAVLFEPELQDETVGLNGKEVLKLTPNRPDITVIAVDTDTTVDANNDGNPQNDDDTRQTLFRSESNALHMWIVNGKEVSMRVGVLYESGDIEFEPVQVSKYGAVPNDNDETVNTSSSGRQIRVMKNDNGTVQLGIDLSEEEQSTSLLLWDFGDGYQSMLNKPIHMFAESGKYDISVEVRDLRTGTVQEKIRDSVTVNRLMDDTPGTVNDEDEGSKDTVQDVPKESSGGSLLGLIVKLILTLLISGAIGAGILFAIGKMKKKGFSLEKSLEKAEEVMVKTPKETVQEVAPPMEIINTPATPPAEPVAEPVVDSVPEPIPTPQPEPEPEPQPEPEASPEPVAPNVPHDAMEPTPEQLETNPNEAPDWLQQGIEKADETEQTTTAPPPESLQTDVEKTQNDKEREERLREKKRQKRQRYRENVKKRKQEEQSSPVSDADEPVAFIKAEDIEPMENSEEKQGS